jgi:hypothetical protein
MHEIKTESFNHRNGWGLGGAGLKVDYRIVETIKLTNNNE